MKVLVLGNGEKSLQLVSILMEWKKYLVEGIVDYRYTNWNQYKKIEKKQILIVSPMKAIEMYQNSLVDGFIMPSLDEDANLKIYKFLKAKDVPDSDILYGHEMLFHTKDFNQENLVCKFVERDELDTIEIHVAEHCNLNCKNCSMFCGLVKKPKYSDFVQTQKSLNSLKGIFSHIKRIRIIGGEPLLNKELDKYLYMIRDIYPYSNIRVITNGILVMNMKDDMIEALKTTSSKLVVTSYLPLISKLDQINEFLKAANVDYEISEVVTEFQKIYDYTGSQNQELSFSTCHWKGACATLYENQIAPCFVPFVIKHLADNFHLNIKPSGTMIVNSKEASKETIRRLFDTSFEMCKFCAPRGVFTCWEMCDEKSLEEILDWSI